MAIFDYKYANPHFSGNLIAESIVLAIYGYQGLENGLNYGYQKYGLGDGLLDTLHESAFGSSHSEGVIRMPESLDSHTVALKGVNALGWQLIDPAALHYTGKTDQYGTYHGETAGYHTAQAEILGKYNEDGQLIHIAIITRGTTGPRENLLPELLGDTVNLVNTLLDKSYSTHYIDNAFHQLLMDVAEFAKQHGLSGEDVLFSGHSLGGISVNGAGYLSDTYWDGFYKDSQFIAFASSVCDKSSDKVINIGFENDSVFRALNGWEPDLSLFGVHDQSQPNSTNNIVNYDDFYVLHNTIMPFSVFNLLNWVAHIQYTDVIHRILDSQFYDLTEQNSTMIVAHLSDPLRDNTWVKDYNYHAEKHTGPTFILGTDKADLLHGGAGNDYLEGGAGNDIFRDDGGNNLILAGDGYDTLDLQSALADYEIAHDGDDLYLLDSEHHLTIANNIDAIKTKEASGLISLFDKTDLYLVNDVGLVHKQHHETVPYQSTLHGNMLDDLLTSESDGQWLFGGAGDDTLVSQHDHSKLIGGLGDDTLYLNGQHHTLMFTGEFGHDTVHGFKAGDKLLVIGAHDSAQDQAYLNHVSLTNHDIIFHFGDNTITLVDMTLDEFDRSQITLS